MIGSTGDGINDCAYIQDGDLDLTYIADITDKTSTAYEMLRSCEGIDTCTFSEYDLINFFDVSATEFTDNIYGNRMYMKIECINAYIEIDGDEVSKVAAAYTVCYFDALICTIFLFMLLLGKYSDQKTENIINETNFNSS